MKAKFDGTNLSTGELNNFIAEMFLLYKGNLIIAIISDNKYAFKTTLHLNITDYQDAEDFSGLLWS